MRRLIRADRERGCDAFFMKEERKREGGKIRERERGSEGVRK